MKNNGFTLLELSIVIVIIGLIVAGISAGQSLVRQAQLRSFVTELASLETAVNTFRLQYSAIPGDMNNASSYWGTGGAGACPTSDCNGNGNRQINTNDERFRAWQHLAFADVIDGSFTGTGLNVTIGVNVPQQIGINN